MKVAKHYKMGVIDADADVRVWKNNGKGSFVEFVNTLHDFERGTGKYSAAQYLEIDEQGVKEALDFDQQKIKDIQAKKDKQMMIPAG